MVLKENMTRKDEQVDEIENRLRRLIEKHGNELMSLAADPSLSRRAFVSQVADQVQALPTSEEILSSFGTH